MFNENSDLISEATHFLAEVGGNEVDLLKFFVLPPKLVRLEILAGRSVMKHVHLRRLMGVFMLPEFIIAPTAYVQPIRVSVKASERVLLQLGLFVTHWKI
jgi:hypothetical protein